MENFETSWCYFGKSAFQQELGQNESSSSEAELGSKGGNAVVQLITHES